MSTVPTSITCPHCRGPLHPVSLACDPCGLEIRGRFVTTEFAGLDDRKLHFLRIFVHCEGRIKDMEKALGVSYPTVKAMMAELKAALGLATDANPEPEPETAPTPPDDAGAVLAAMQRGEIPYEEALNRIRKSKKGSKP